MTQKDFSEIIKDIRKSRGMTQKDFANKYNVTCQAVSKWETGKNMPDMLLIKQIAKDFDISIDEMFDGNYTKKKIMKKRYIGGLIVLVIVILIMSIILLEKDNSFEFKTLSTTCNNFNISGSLSYNKSKTAIYISNIEYCGGDDNVYYQRIECILYESNNSIETRIDEDIYDKTEKIQLDKFLKNVTFSIDNYSQSCKEYWQNSLYLQINAYDSNNKITSYKVPLTLKEICPK